ncbi:MAG: phosphatase PAP2 family protein [Alphaproteobacteria bacterium]
MIIPSQRVTSRTGWGLTVMALSLLAFFGLGAAMLTGMLEALDRDLLLVLRGSGGLGDPVGSRGIEEAVRDLTALGGTTLVAVTTVAVSLFLLAQRQGRHAVVLAGVVLLAWLTKDTAKHLFGRARPDLVPHEVFVSSASFPSGHTTMGTVLLLTLAVLASRYGPSGRGRLLIYGYAVLLAGLVGFSRVYLGVHWPSDVLAGWCLGAFWAATAWVGLRVSAKSAEVR